MRVHPMLCAALFAAFCAEAAAAQSPNEPAPTPTIRMAEPTATAPVARRLSAEEQAVADLQAKGREKVAELLVTLATVSDGPARLALEKKIEDVKRDNWIALLQLHLTQAEAKHDAAKAAEVRALIDHILHPPVATPAQVQRPIPVAAPTEGSR